MLIARSGGRLEGLGPLDPAFDLHAGLAACAEHLDRFGGHRAAAGLSIRPSRSRRSPRRSPPTPTRVLADDELRPVTTIDAVVPVAALTLDLAQELDRLAPFGLGNPEPTLLVASVRADRAATRSARASTSASAFASTAATAAARSPSGSARSSTGSRAGRATTSPSG